MSVECYSPHPPRRRPPGEVLGGLGETAVEDDAPALAVPGRRPHQIGGVPGEHHVDHEVLRDPWGRVAEGGGWPLFKPPEEGWGRDKQENRHKINIYLQRSSLFINTPVRV